MPQIQVVARWCLVTLLVAVGPLEAQGASPHHPAPEVYALLRLVVTDSLVRSGTQKGQLLFAADSLSQRSLTAAGLAVDIGSSARSIRCPGRTTSAGAVAQPIAGYLVRVALTARPDSGGWLLDVGKSCMLSNNGGPGGGQLWFREGCAWEIRIVVGRWRIAHRLDCVIT